MLLIIHQERWGLKTMTDSELFWNVTLGKNQGATGNLDDAFIWAATGIGGQMLGRFIGDVPANERKISRLQFKDVRATVRAGRLEAVGVRRRAKSSGYHSAQYLTIAK